MNLNMLNSYKNDSRKIASSDRLSNLLSYNANTSYCIRTQRLLKQFGPSDDKWLWKAGKKLV